MDLTSLIILLGVAVAPAIFLVYFLWLRDKFEREPLKLVWKAFWFGAFAVVPAFILEAYIMVPLGHALGYSSGFESTLWQAFIVAGLVEEACKAVFTRWAVWRNHNFNEPMDGIVYFGAGALGFATLENVLYVLQGGLATGLDRAFLSAPGHALFGVIMGYHFGLYRFGPAGSRGSNLLLGIAVPVMLHGAYDVIALNIENHLMSLLMYPMVAYMWVQGLKNIGHAQAVSPFNGETRQCGTCNRAFAGQQYQYCPYCGGTLGAPAD